MIYHSAHGPTSILPGQFPHYCCYCSGWGTDRNWGWEAAF